MIRVSSLVKLNDDDVLLKILKYKTYRKGFIIKKYVYLIRGRSGEHYIYFLKLVLSDRSSDEFNTFDIVRYFKNKVLKSNVYYISADTYNEIYHYFKIYNCM